MSAVIDDSFQENTVSRTNVYRDELRANQGSVGPAIDALFNRLMRQQVRRFSDCALRDGSLRTVEELSWDFYEDCGQQISVKILTGFLPSDDAVERYVARSMKHWLINEFKKTPTGKLYDLLVHRMRRDKERRFLHVAGTSMWRLSDGKIELSSLPEERLVAISRRYPITMGHHSDSDEWSSQLHKHRAPNIGKRGELENLLEGLFAEAGGALELMTLVRVLKHRLPRLADPSVVSLEDVGGADDKEFVEWQSKMF